jgi:hypothetical protein
MMQITEKIRRHLGWCPNAPVMRTAPAVLMVPSVVVHPVQPGSRGASGSPGRIGCGIGIATGSIKTLVRNRQLFWFSFLTGLVVIFMIAVETWTVATIQSNPPFFFDIPFFGSELVIDTRLFLLQVICLFFINVLLAGLILNRARAGAGRPVTVRESLGGVTASAGSLATLSLGMALTGTVLFEIVNRNQFFGKIIMTVDMAVFYMPYAYYIPDAISAGFLFSFIAISINIVLFLLALYEVPVIVLEHKGVFSALVGSARLMMKTWQELLGCILILGVIILGVGAIALVIGRSPLLLNHDYDFFLQFSRGQILMTLVCYGFLLACGMLMAVGSTALGIAIVDLYTCGRTGIVPEVPEITRITAAGPS